VAPTASREEGHTEATLTGPSKALPPRTADGVDQMYHQLAEIHAIATTQLAECVHWCRSNLTPNTAHADPGWQGPTAEPSATRMAPPPTNFSPLASL
jgi:hypothetical protein